MSITQETRRESNRKTDRETRYQKILAVLEPGVELTAREIKDALGLDDMDAVRPRLIGLGWHRRRFRFGGHDKRRRAGLTGKRFDGRPGDGERNGSNGTADRTD